MQIASDPTIYRLFEIASEYGPAIKAVINEKFGDGIMSAVDLKIYVDKEVHGTEEQRIKLTFNGKFLPYTKW